jgi:hypothetical protein
MQQEQKQHEKSGRFYRKFAHIIEKKEKTSRRLRRRVRWLLKTQPEKVIEEQR